MRLAVVLLVLLWALQHLLPLWDVCRSALLADQLTHRLHLATGVIATTVLGVLVGCPTGSLAWATL